MAMDKEKKGLLLQSGPSLQLEQLYRFYHFACHDSEDLAYTWMILASFMVGPLSDR
jgi:hypothetical protein